MPPAALNQRAAKGPAKVVRNTKRMLAYILDIPATLAANQVVIELARRLRKPNGDWSELKLWRHSGTPTLAQHRYDPEDEDLLALLTGAASPAAGPGQRLGRRCSARRGSRSGPSGRRRSSRPWRGPSGSGSAAPGARRSRRP